MHLPFVIRFCGIALCECPKVCVVSCLMTRGTENFMRQHGGVRVCTLPRSERKVVGIMEGTPLTSYRGDTPLTGRRRAIRRCTAITD
jgi:hypothetical protein